MFEFSIYYFMIGLTINQLLAIVAQGKLRTELGYNPSPNSKEIILGSFIWPLVLLNVIEGLFTKKDEE